MVVLANGALVAGCGDREGGMQHHEAAPAPASGCLYCYRLDTGDAQVGASGGGGVGRMSVDMWVACRSGCGW